MATKVKNETTGVNVRRGRGVKGASINNEVQNEVVNAVSAVTAGVGNSHDVAVAVASCVAVPSPVVTGRASAVANMIDASEVKLSELRAKVVSHFAVPEWSEYGDTVEKLRKMFPDWSEEQIAAAAKGAAKNAGVDLTAPVCSVPRVLAVIRCNYAKELEQITGFSLDSVRAFFRSVSPAVFSLKMPLGSVRANSKLEDYVSSCPVTSDMSASAIVSAVLSVRIPLTFNRAKSAAVADSRSEISSGLATVWRNAQRLGLSYDDVLAELRGVAYYVSETDSKQRKQLHKNMDYAYSQINAINDMILLAGGAACIDGLDGADGSDKQRAKVRKLVAKRDRYTSVVATCAGLLDL